MQVKLNFHEECQLDVLFGSSRNSHKSSARKEDQKMSYSENWIVEDQFKLASQGVMMPSAPKSKVNLSLNSSVWTVASQMNILKQMIKSITNPIMNSPPQPNHSIHFRKIWINKHHWWLGQKVRG